MSTKQKLEQAGIVSLIVTFILMIVISLIVLGFSESTRRNARETLDRELSSQAYYAAESAVNDAIDSYNTSPLLAAADATDCRSFISSRSLVSNLSSGVQYTCLLVNDKLRTLEDTVPLGQSVVENVHLDAASSEMSVSWTNDGSSAISGCPAKTATGSLLDADTFKTTNGCRYALLRMDIVPAATAPDADSLASATKTFYLMPTNNTPTVPSVDAVVGSGNIFGAYCNTGSGTCKVKFTDVSPFGSDFFIRLSTVYNGAPRVSIGDLTSGGLFKGSELQIDATGQAQDQLRRVQVRAKLNNSGTVPVNALSSTTGICKRFITLGEAGSLAMPTSLCKPD